MFEFQVWVLDIERGKIDKMQQQPQSNQHNKRYTWVFKYKSSVKHVICNKIKVTWKCLYNDTMFFFLLQAWIELNINTFYPLKLSIKTAF